MKIIIPTMGEPDPGIRLIVDIAPHAQGSPGEIRVLAEVHLLVERSQTPQRPLVYRKVARG
jgi:hypothetical protein